MNSLPPVCFEKNESVYSILARVHRIVGYKNPLKTFNLVLGVRGYKPLSGLPTHLNQLFKSLDLAKTVPEIIRDHTHYPLYEPFVKVEKRLRVMQAMHDAGAVKSILGLLRNHVGASESLRYCEACVEIDSINCGFPYWHREHLLPWIYFCPHHEKPLKYIDFNLIDFKERALLIPFHGKELRYIGSNSAIDKLRILSADTIFLINRRNAGDVVIDKDIYHNILKELCLCSKGGHVNQKLIFKCVSDWLKDIKKLTPFDCLVDSLLVERSWAANVASDSKGFHHPLKHLILLRSLGLTLDDMFLATQSWVQETLLLDLPKDSGPTDEEIRIAIAEESSIRKAADRLGVDVTTLCCAANRLKIAYTRRTKYITSDIIETVIGHARTGIPSANIAERLGISVTSINRIKRAYVTETPI